MPARPGSGQGTLPGSRLLTFVSVLTWRGRGSGDLSAKENSAFFDKDTNLIPEYSALMI